MNDTTDASAVRVAAELGRLVANAAPATPYTLTPDTSVVVRTVRRDEELRITDLEHLLPRPHRPRGSVELFEPSDFITYVQRLCGAGTTVWADAESATFTAVFNDHENTGTAGWRDHRATLRLQRDCDWIAWLRRDHALGSQTEFADHLEDLAHTVTHPDAATMLEVATSFQARKGSSFSRAVRTDSGDVQLSWHEDTMASAGASGQLDVPREFTLCVAPFVGVPAAEVTARLRYRIKDGTLSIGYVLSRRDIVERTAFADIRQALCDALAVPVLVGEAPGPVL